MKRAAAEKSYAWGLRRSGLATAGTCDHPPTVPSQAALTAPAGLLGRGLPGVAVLVHRLQVVEVVRAAFSLGHLVVDERRWRQQAGCLAALALAQIAVALKDKLAQPLPLGAVASLGSGAASADPSASPPRPPG